MLIPKRCYDARDCKLSAADRYLKTMLRPVLRSRDFKRGRLAVVITADGDNSRGVNDVYTVVLLRQVAAQNHQTHFMRCSLSRLLSEVSGSRPLRKARTGAGPRPHRSPGGSV